MTLAHFTLQLNNFYIFFLQITTFGGFGSLCLLQQTVPELVGGRGSPGEGVLGYYPAGRRPHGIQYPGHPGRDLTSIDPWNILELSLRS